jgi:inhibitor of cysteine peptidase
MIRSRAVWGSGLTFALVVTLSGCQTPKPREVDATASGTTVKLVRDQDLVVSLDANATTGYRWLLQAHEKVVLQPVGEPSYVPRVGDPRLVGAGGVTTFKFHAIAAGRETLVFTYRRPWEMNLPPAKMVRFEITVEQP